MHILHELLGLREKERKFAGGFFFLLFFLLVPDATHCVSPPPPSPPTDPLSAPHTESCSVFPQRLGSVLRLKARSQLLYCEPKQKVVIIMSSSPLNVGLVLIIKMNVSNGTGFNYCHRMSQ